MGRSLSKMKAFLVLTFVGCISAQVVTQLPPIGDLGAELKQQIIDAYNAMCITPEPIKQTPKFPIIDKPTYDFEAIGKKVCDENAEKYKQINNGKNADVLTMEQLREKYPEIADAFDSVNFSAEKIAKLRLSNKKATAKKTKESVEKVKEV